MTVPVTSSDPFFLEVPFDRIADIKVQTNTLVASQDPGVSENLYQLLLDMKTGVWNHYVYAEEAEARNMLFTFNDESQAQQAAMFLKEECAQTPVGALKMSMSQPLNISQEAEASTSPEKLSEAAPEAASSQAMDFEETVPASPEALPSLPPDRLLPQHKSTRSTIRGSNTLTKTTMEVGTPGPKARSSETVKTNVEPETEQSVDATKESEGKTRPAAGNLSTLLSVALSPEPDEPIYYSATKTRKVVDGNIKKFARSLISASKQKPTANMKVGKSKQGKPISKKLANTSSRVAKKSSATTSNQFDSVAENEIWEIPDDPIELKTTAANKKGGKGMTTSAKDATRKAPAGTAKAVVNQQRSRVIDSDSDIESADEKEDNTFRAARTLPVPPSSPRRSTRLQASTGKQKLNTAHDKRNRVDDAKSRKFDTPSSLVERSPRSEASNAKQRNGAVGQTSKPTGVKKGSTAKSANATAYKHEPQHETKPNARRKKQNPITFDREYETPSLDPALQVDIRETIEAFEEAVVDFESAPELQETRIIIKKEPGMKSKTPDTVSSKNKETQKSPICIASDPDSDNDYEEEAVLEGTEEVGSRPQKATTTIANDTQDHSKAENRVDAKGACDEVSVVEDSYALAKRNTTPKGASDPTLVDNKSTRKMAIISFDRSGPRNQGSRLGLRFDDGTPTVRSDPLQPRDASEAAGKHRVLLAAMTFQTQHTLPIPGRFQQIEAGESRNDKRPASHVIPEIEPIKRQRTSQSISKDDGLLDVETYSDTAGRLSRRASLRSVHVTDGGSPMRIDMDEEVNAMTADFVDIEDNFLHQGSSPGIGVPMVQATAQQVAATLQNTKAMVHALNVTRSQERPTQARSSDHDSSSAIQELAPRSAQLQRNWSKEDFDGKESAEQELVSRPTPSGHERSLIPVSLSNGPLRQPTGDYSRQTTLEAFRRRSSSARTQRSTAPVSSNHKPIPLPPGLDSQFISAYAPEQAVEEAVARNRADEIAHDPFSSSQKNDEADKSVFMRRLAMLMEEGHSNSLVGNVAHDADKTLVEDVPMEDVESLSSSDEGLTVVEEVSEDEYLENADEMEWEAALEPRHRDMFDVLGRITRRLVSHLIDCETAVDDIVDDYNRDGTRIVDEFGQCYRSQQNNMGGLQASMAKLKRLYGDTERQIEQDLKVLQADRGSVLHDWKGGLQGKKNAIEQMEQMISA